jgi:hypothetical protein
MTNITFITFSAKKFVKGINIATAIIMFGIVVGMFGTEVRAEEVNPRVLVNNEQIHFQEVLPVIRDSRVLIPLRGVFEKLGFDIQWDADANTATLVKGELNITLAIGDEAITANGERKVYDVPLQIIQDRFLVPLRAISELSGAMVDWIDEDKTVIISTDEGAVVVVTVTPTPTPVVEASPTPTPIVVSEGELPPGNIIVESKMTLNGITFYLGETKESIESKFGKPLSVEQRGPSIAGTTAYFYKNFEAQYSSTRMLVLIRVKDLPFSKEGYYIGMKYDYPDRNLSKDESWVSSGGAYPTSLDNTVRGADGNILYMIQLRGDGDNYNKIPSKTYNTLSVYRKGFKDWTKTFLYEPDWTPDSN